MIKGVLIGFAIIIILAPIPIVHIVGIPFGPFIGGYYGISAVLDSRDSPGRKAMVFGAWTGFLMLVVAAIVVGTIDAIFDLNHVLRIILWGCVGVLPFYYGTMAGLGAWYAELKAKG
jgi:hypothetical protein